MNEEITLHTEHTVARCTGKYTFILKFPLTSLAVPVSLELLHWNLSKGWEREEMVEGSGEVGGRHQSQTTDFAFHGKLCVLGMTLWTEVSSQR